MPKRPSYNRGSTNEDANVVLEANTKGTIIVGTYKDTNRIWNWILSLKLKIFV